MPKFKVLLTVAVDDVPTVIEQCTAFHISTAVLHTVKKYAPPSSQATTKTIAPGWVVIGLGAGKTMLEVVEVKEFNPDMTVTNLTDKFESMKMASFKKMYGGDAVPTGSIISFGIKKLEQHGSTKITDGIEVEVKDIDQSIQVPNHVVEDAPSTGCIPKGIVLPSELVEPSEFLSESTHPFNDVCNEWGVNPLLNLSTWCANFYTLYYLTLDHPDVKPEFEDCKEKLLVQFVNYIDMAIGGELRHSQYRAHGVEKVKSISKLHKEIIERMQTFGGRGEAWKEWRGIRDIYGLAALEVAEDCFKKATWNGAYGGKKWGTAAEILRHLLEGSITGTAYIDTIWSLQHNCNFILDKVWPIPHNLKFILDCKVEDKIKPFVKYCTKEVRELWKTKTQIQG